MLGNVARLDILSLMGYRDMDIDKITAEEEGIY